MDFERVKFMSGIDAALDDVLTVFNHELVQSPGSKKIFFPAFIEFQYDIGRDPSLPKFNLKNNAHLGVIKQLKRHGFDPSPWMPGPGSHPVDLAPKSQRGDRVSLAPHIGAKEQEEEKDKDKEQEKEQESPVVSISNWPAENQNSFARYIQKIEREHGINSAQMQQAMSLWGSTRIEQALTDKQEAECAL